MLLLCVKLRLPKVLDQVFILFQCVAKIVVLPLLVLVGPSRACAFLLCGALLQDKYSIAIHLTFATTLAHLEAMDHLRSDILRHLALQGCAEEIMLLTPVFGARPSVLKIVNN